MMYILHATYDSSDHIQSGQNQWDISQSESEGAEGWDINRKHARAGGGVIFYRLRLMNQISFLRRETPGFS